MATNRYHLFAGDHIESIGGIMDYIGTYETLGVAKAKFENWFRGGPSTYWAHIVVFNGEELKIVSETQGGVYGPSAYVGKPTAWLDWKHRARVEVDVEEA